MIDPSLSRGLGEYEITSGNAHKNGSGQWSAVTNVRKLAERERKPGSRLIWASVALLGALAGVAFYVSYAAQFGFVYEIKRVTAAAAAEALIPDAGMMICAMLALAMAVQGRSAKAARVCVVGFAALSAVMNYMAANSHQAHAITVYVMPPVAFAVCTDLVVSVVRRFYYGIAEGSPWAALGRVLKAAVRGLGLILLYLLRFALARRETFRGLRQIVLDAVPLPESDPDPEPDPETPANETKKTRLLRLYRVHPDYGNRAAASRVATELAPQAGLQPGTARTYLYAELDGTRTAS
jgi:Protein of unknown function (DUF2637)